MFSRSRCSSYSVSTDEQRRVEVPAAPRRRLGRRPPCAAPRGRAARSGPRRGWPRRRRRAPAAVSATTRLNSDTASNSRSSVAGCSSTRPRRNESSRFSRLCDRLVMRVTPKRPDSPLSECTARKASLMTSGSKRRRPRARRRAPNRSRLNCSMISCASERNSCSAFFGRTRRFTAAGSGRSRGAARARTAWSDRRWRRA